ncbi:MAG: AMMECR1 domain protein [Ignavibacteria bacterium]|nr:MAG: AMMECR1 domain protein [Ignavibacteria bacterium]KAF0156400.1 MAG: AMMECR1 domain protein [Ignavibacteria bacterium]
MDLTSEEKKILLAAARNSILSLFETVTIEKPDYKKHPVLKSHSGAFVTLTENKRLRGCIGYIIGDKAVFETVCEAAIQAAKYDPRFSPVRKEEIKDISLEISILSKPFPLNCYDEIELGKHGLILQEQGRRGLLLPQVPIEHKMNKEEYLDAICQKSGFNKSYWKEKELKLSAFTATVFSEEEI